MSQQDHQWYRPIAHSSFLRGCGQRTPGSAIWLCTLHIFFSRYHHLIYWECQSTVEVQGGSSGTKDFLMYKELFLPTSEIFPSQACYRCNNFHRRRWFAWLSIYNDRHKAKSVSGF